MIMAKPDVQTVKKRCLVYCGDDACNCDARQWSEEYDRKMREFDRQEDDDFIARKFQTGEHHAPIEIKGDTFQQEHWYDDNG